MKTNLKALASLVLVSAVSTAYAQSTAAPRHRYHHKMEKKDSIEAQIQALREQMEEQRDEINELQQKLNQRDEQLQQAQAAAEQAQAAAQQAQAAADQQQQALNSNAQAVSSLQSSVADLKASNQQVVASVKRQTSALKKAVLHPDEIHYKGITISPHGSFLAAETVWRQGATGGGLNTAFTAIPLDNAPDANIS